MSVFLNVRETVWDFLVSKNLETDEDLLKTFAKKLHYNKTDIEDIVNFFKEEMGESFTFNKILNSIKKKDDIDDDSGEDIIEGLEPSFIVPNHVCKKCKKTYTKFGLDTYLRIIYINHEDHMCPDCFAEKLKERDLTEEEIENIAKERYEIIYNTRTTTWGSKDLDPTIFTQKQIDIIDNKVEEFKAQEEKIAEQTIAKKYEDKAEELVRKAGYGPEDMPWTLVKLVSFILRDIDEKFDKAYNKTPLSEIVFR